MRSETCESIKRDRDYLQQQLDDQRRVAEESAERQWRERQQRRREREEQRRRNSPSNRLYNGLVDSLPEATYCHIQACESELSCSSLQPNDDDDYFVRIKNLAPLQT